VLIDGFTDISEFISNDAQVCAQGNDTLPAMQDNTQQLLQTKEKLVIKNDEPKTITAAAQHDDDSSTMALCKR